MPSRLLEDFTGLYGDRDVEWDDADLRFRLCRLPSRMIIYLVLQALTSWVHSTETTGTVLIQSSAGRARLIDQYHAKQLELKDQKYAPEIPSSGISQHSKFAADARSMQGSHRCIRSFHFLILTD